MWTCYYYRLLQAATGYHRLPQAVTGCYRLSETALLPNFTIPGYLFVIGQAEIALCGQLRLCLFGGRYRQGSRPAREADTMIKLVRLVRFQSILDKNPVATTTENRVLPGLLATGQSRGHECGFSDARPS